MRVALKRAVVARLTEKITEDVAVLTRAAMAAREAAHHEDAKPENDKDTRAIEAGYLAGAQAECVRDLERAVHALATMDVRDFGDGDIVAQGALVELDGGGVEGAPSILYFLAPAA